MAAVNHGECYAFKYINRRVGADDARMMQGYTRYIRGEVSARSARPAKSGEFYYT